MRGGIQGTDAGDAEADARTPGGCKEGCRNAMGDARNDAGDVQGDVRDAPRDVMGLRGVMRLFKVADLSKLPGGYFRPNSVELMSS